MDNKLFIKLSRKVGQTIQKHSLIEPNDRLLVGLSGGKDSYALLEILADRKKHLPFSFDLFAVHVIINEVGYLNDLEYMKNLCTSLNVPLHIIHESVDLFKDTKKVPCYVCSWHRRKKIFDLTKELNCNKLAFGHHMDDALQTFMLNLIYHGSISSLPFKLKMFDGRVHLVRPLLDIDELQIQQISVFHAYPKEITKCPYDKKTKRNEVSNLLSDIYRSHKLARKNMFRAMDKIFTEYLPHKQ
jgi:tRNA 2-thiocytidine biosynthesis protein TtcA